MKKLIINYLTREKRFAVIANKKVEKIVIDQPQQQSSVGNIYWGTVSKVLPGMNAVFIDIGEEKHGFMHRDKLPGYLCSQEPSAIRKNIPVSKFAFQGEKLLVQVEKDATGTKGPRLTGIIELSGTNVIYLPKGKAISVSKKIASAKQREDLQQFGRNIKAENEGFIFRTTAVHSSEPELLTEIEQLRTENELLVKEAEQLKHPGLLRKRDYFFEQIAQEVQNAQFQLEVYVDDLALKKTLERTFLNVPIHFYQGKENIFSVYNVEHEIEYALHKTVALENGAYLIFDETEALTIIDVNTGKFSGKSTLAETVLETNILAAKEVVRQLRLRDIGGMVLIDFIEMKLEKDRKLVLGVIEAELKGDTRRTKLIGFTPLGILQLTRQKTKTALSESMMVACPVCEGSGRVLSPETIAFRLERELWEHRLSDYEAVWVETTEEVALIFSGPKEEHQERLEAALGLKIFLSKVSNAKPFYMIRQFGTEREISLKNRH